MTEFLLSPLARYLFGAIALIAAAVGAYTYMRVHYYNEGYASALHAIAAQDQRAIDAAKKARETVAACRNGGGTWNVDGGVCVK